MGRSAVLASKASNCWSAGVVCQLGALGRPLHLPDLRMGDGVGTRHSVDRGYSRNLTGCQPLAAQR